MLLLVLIVIACLAAVATHLALQWAISRQILDHPNARSSHATPTPRGGGLAIVLAFYVGITGIWFAGHIDNRDFAALLCGIPVAAVGYVDDLRTVSPKWRIAVHAASTATALSVLSPLPALTHTGGEISPWLSVLTYGVGIVWLTNLYNFMDGIDAMAGSQAVAIGLIWATYLPNSHALTAVVFAAAALGFLVHNWPPARIFMGDVGSGFLGFTCGILVLVFSRSTGTSPFIWFLPLLIFACDATVTLVVRAMRGQPLSVAHRSHAYQHLARRAGKHLPVSLGYMAATLIISFFGMPWTLKRPEHAFLALAFFSALIITTMIFLKAGRDD